MGSSTRSWIGSGICLLIGIGFSVSPIHHWVAAISFWVLAAALAVWAGRGFILRLRIRAPLYLARTGSGAPQVTALAYPELVDVGFQGSDVWIHCVVGFYALTAMKEGPLELVLNYSDDNSNREDLICRLEIPRSPTSRTIPAGQTEQVNYWMQAGTFERKNFLRGIQDTTKVSTTSGHPTAFIRLRVRVPGGQTGESHRESGIHFDEGRDIIAEVKNWDNAFKAGHVSSP